MTNTYVILEEKREELEKKLNRLAKKAQKYGVPFSVSYGENYAMDIERTDDFDEKYTETYEVFDFTLESEVIKKDGYTVIAHIEHASNGNIVTTFGCDAKAEWVQMGAFCEHCNSNHNLKYTFLVSNGKEIKQVGRTCLKDYCGIDPQVIAMMNEFTGELEDYTIEGYDFREPIPCVYDATEVLAHAIDITNEQGYIKSDEPDSNKAMLIKRISDRPSASAVAEAEKMAEAIKAMSVEESVDAMINNVKIRLEGWYCKPSEFGYFAYAPTAMRKYEERKAREAKRAQEKAEMGAVSNYVGSIGERETFEVKEATLLTSWANNYGMTFLYRFIDENGNVLVWFASTTIDTDNVSKIKATVKDHSERDGVKQTIITRVKVA